MKKVIWMFSGQGSQYFGMGRKLYESDPVFRDTMNRCDEIVRRTLKESLLDVIYRPCAKDRFADFIELRHTHPALFSVQYSLAQMLLRRGAKPDLLLGYSLGEIVGATVSGALSLESALELLMEQVRQLTASAETGAMLAVLESPAIWDSKNPVFGDTWIAARNTPQHFVLSGTKAAIDRVQQHLGAREITYCRLPVAIAFHSPLMDSLEQTYRRQCLMIKTSELRYPLVSAAYMREVQRVTPDYFWDVVRRPIGFQETISRLESGGPSVYVDLGPSGTMAAFLKYNLGPGSSSRAYPILTPFNRTQDTLLQIDSVLKDVARESGC